MASFVRIALAGVGSFAKMEIRAGDDISDLAKRACIEFPSWKADSAQLSLYLVVAGGDEEPTEEVIKGVLSSGGRLGVGWSLSRAEIFSGAWLVARKIADSGASLSGGGGGGGGGGDVVALLSAFVAEALSPAQAHAFRFHAAFSADREALQAHAFNARSVNNVRAKLRNVLSSTTRSRFLLASGIVMDGPVGASTGQAGTVVLHALCGARALCAKVGPRAVVRREWAAMEAVHGRGARLAPTVACAEGCEDIPSADAPGRAALLLPVYPLSLADALVALPAGPSHTRDALSASVALCGLAAIAAFVRAGWSHGDIKPANIMLTGTSATCVLIDLGTARAVGDSFSESSIFSLNEPRVASAGYDLVCLGATLAMLQLELFVVDGVTTRESLLEAVRRVAADAVSPLAPAALAAEGALALGARASVGIEDVRALAEAVAGSAAALGAPALDDIWPRDA